MNVVPWRRPHRVGTLVGVSWRGPLYVVPWKGSPVVSSVVPSGSPKWTPAGVRVEGVP